MAANIRMTLATLGEAWTLARRVRAVEVDELRAATGQTVLEVLVEAIGKSDEAWALYIDNELAGMWGVVPAESDILTGRCGSAWLLTTDAIDRHKLSFWRLCRAYVPLLLLRWNLLYNFIDARHVRAIRWAERLGFRLEEPRPYGVAGLPFRPFTATREALCARPQ